MADRPGPGDSPFPPRVVDSLRTDSPAEEAAFLAAWPAPNGAWRAVESVFIPGIPSTQKRLVLQAPDGARAVLHFLVGSYRDAAPRPRPLPTAPPAIEGARHPPVSPSAGGSLPAERLEAAMRAGHDLAKAEGPLHPGAMPQYPVPSPAHAGTVAVPLPILAIDAGQRWLYAPPRIAVVRWPSAEAVGVGDAPGFSPRHWPPPRLGEWPPATVRGWEQQRLAGAIARFTAIWGRLLDVWFGGERYPQLDDERLEALLLLALLLPPPMLHLYAELSPQFWKWLAA